MISEKGLSWKLKAFNLKSNVCLLSSLYFRRLCFLFVNFFVDITFDWQERYFKSEVPDGGKKNGRDNITPILVDKLNLIKVDRMLLSAHLHVLENVAQKVHAETHPA